MVPAHPLRILFVMSGRQWQDNSLQNTEFNVLCVLLLIHIRTERSRSGKIGGVNSFESLSFDYAQDEKNIL
jgi:hypothetical protein